MHSAESRCYKNGIVAGHIWRKGSHCCENGRSARTENASSSALSMNSWCHLRLFAECESVVKEELFMTRNEGCWVFLLHYTVTVKTMSHVKWNRMIAGDENWNDFGYWLQPFSSQWLRFHQHHVAVNTSGCKTPCKYFPEERRAPFTLSLRARDEIESSFSMEHSPLNDCPTYTHAHTRLQVYYVSPLRINKQDEKILSSIWKTVKKLYKHHVSRLFSSRCYLPSSCKHRVVVWSVTSEQAYFIVIFWWILQIELFWAPIQTWFMSPGAGGLF